jgi:hypothetical protein
VSFAARREVVLWLARGKAGWRGVAPGGYDATAGHSPALIARLTEVERQLEKTRKLATPAMRTQPELQAEKVRELVFKSLMDLPKLLSHNLRAAKKKLSESIESFVITPVGEGKTREFHHANQVESMG